MNEIRSFIARLGIGILVCTSAVQEVAAAEPAGVESRKPNIPDLKIENYTLPNGLTVILHQDHKTPVVSVNVLYKVGSKDEQRGRTGFAHLFEHMMFQGSKNHNSDYFIPLEKLGAQLNGSTSEDDTVYYETVPSNALELVLWLEADRMGFLIPSMTQQKLDNQRDVVKNERRQSVDNVPYGQTEELLLTTLYPPEHPYHHSVIGSMTDLSAAALGDVAAFFRTYYVPNNAILCIAGDFQPDQAKQWIEKYFASLARGPEVKRPERSVPTLSGPLSVRSADAVSLPRVQLIWPTVPSGHIDEPALDVLAAVLGELPKENRLFRALMYDRQLAAGVSASHPTQLLAGTFEIELYARPGEALDQIVKITDGLIEVLKSEGPTPLEVRKAQNERESALIMGLQSVTRKAAVLNKSMEFHGDPLGYRTELQKVFKVTPEDVKRVARQYLGARRIELDVVPGAPASRPPESDVDRSKQAPLEAPRLAEVTDRFDRSAAPRLGPTPHYAPPPFQRRALSNGLKLLIIERHELPIATFDLIVKSGETSTPRGKEGLGSLAASLLDEGTKTRDSLQIAGEQAEIGASVVTAGELESTTVSLTTLTRHLERGLDLYADIILHPSFPEKELNRIRIQRLAAIKARSDDAEQTAEAIFPQLIYGLDHPYGRPVSGTVTSVKSISQHDVVAFYEQIMVPGNAALVIVGDVQPDAITTAIETRLRAWPAAPVPAAPSLKPPASPPHPSVYLIDKPGAAQSVLKLGRIGASRTSPDFFNLRVMDAILGGQFVSRINMNLREDKGYSYGAESHFSFLKGPGPFEIGATVQTVVTKESLVEIMKELTDINGPRPVTDAELSFAKEGIILGFPGRFETTFGVAGQIGLLVVDDLPDDEFAHYQERVAAVTRADVDRVARDYVTPATMSILVVGDRARTEGLLKSLPFVPAVQQLDTDGSALAPPAGVRPAGTAAEPSAARRARAGTN
jgi:zinc protease